MLIANQLTIKYTSFVLLNQKLTNSVIFFIGLAIFWFDFCAYLCYEGPANFLSLGSDNFSATFYQTYFLLKTFKVFPLY